MMKAICVTEAHALELREVPEPGRADLPGDHVLVEMEASAINHGDKMFLARPTIASGLNTSRHNIWGASGAGRVLAAGNDLPVDLIGRKVAIYRSLTASPHTVGLWSDQAVVPFTSCVVLPEDVEAIDYSGSLVNAITAYSFLEEMEAKQQKGVVVTAGSSATGLAMAALLHDRQTPAIFLVRSTNSRDALRSLGVEHVLSTTDADFQTHFERLAEELQTTAVFDGVGGELISSIAPLLPVNSNVSIYGFLGGPAPVSIPTGLFMSKNLVMQRFSNFNSATVRDTKRLREALRKLSQRIGDPLFRTKIGQTFRLDQIHEAIAYETTPGRKAVLLMRAK
jgi:NADPH:quinone reductase-like Zn-dependent oxidoreductase